MNEKNWIVMRPAARKAICAAARDTITQSEIMCRASCARKWFYRFAMMFEKRGFFSDFLIYGSIMHQLLESYYRCEQSVTSTALEIAAEMRHDVVLTPTQVEDVLLIARKVQIAYEAYVLNYREADAKMKVIAVEMEPQVFFEGLKFSGKIDLVSRPNGPDDGIFIWDYKSTFRLSPMIVTGWTFRFQFLFYAWLYWKFTGKKPDGIMVQGLLKSQLRPKKSEHQEAFLERIREEMAGDHRSEYFYRERIPLGTDALERFEHETLWPHAEAFQRLRTGGPNMEALAMQQNTNQCHVYGSTCEYLQLCKDGWSAAGEYERREKKHGELGNGSE